MKKRGQIAGKVSIHGTFRKFCFLKKSINFIHGIIAFKIGIIKEIPYE